MHERTPTPLREIDPDHRSVIGYYRNGRPFVVAGVFLPGRPNLSGTANFTLDLDSDISLLAPFDARRLGCHTNNETISKPLGWKGSIDLGFEVAALVFKGIAFHNVTLGIVATEPVPHARMPSILGTDVLRRCRIVMEPHIGFLRIVPKNSDSDDANTNVVRYEQQFRDDSPTVRSL